MTRRKRKWTLVTLLLSVLVITGMNQFTKWRAGVALREYAAQFSQEGTPNATVLSMPRIFIGGEKKPHGVLLIHGVPASCSTFAALCDQLQEEGIPHIAPTLTGFGNRELNLLPHVHYEDWLRDALVGYEMLAQCVERISIVSTSTGGLVATWLSGQREVDDMVLLAPNFSPGPTAARFKAILETPVASQLLKVIMPYKFSDPEDFADTSRFRYPFFEVNSSEQMFLLQDAVDPDQIRVEQGLYLITGRSDTKVSSNDLPAVLEEHARKHGKQFQAHEFESGHALLQGAAAEKVRALIVEILKN
jgi:esterase/lipase